MTRAYATIPFRKIRFNDDLPSLRHVEDRSQRFLKRTMRRAQERAVDANGDVLDILVQSRRNRAAALRLIRKLFKASGQPRVIVTDKLRPQGPARAVLAPGIEHRQHNGLNNRSEASHRHTRREKVMGRVKSLGQAQRFLSLHDQTAAPYADPRATAFQPAHTATPETMPSISGMNSRANWRPEPTPRKRWHSEPNNLTEPTAVLSSRV